MTPGAHLTEHGCQPPLEAGEIVVCGSCEASWSSADQYEIWNEWDQRPQCPECDAYGGFRRIKTQPGVERRWPPGVATPFAPVPHVLIRHASSLGISAAQLHVILALETWPRRNPADPVYPSVATVARRIGRDERTVRRHIATLCEAGLLSREERRANGRWTTNHLRRTGLNRALRLIADNELEGHPPLQGLNGLLDELRQNASTGASSGRRSLRPGRDEPRPPDRPDRVYRADASATTGQGCPPTKNSGVEKRRKNLSKERPVGAHDAADAATESATSKARSGRAQAGGPGRTWDRFSKRNRAEAESQS